MLSRMQAPIESKTENKRVGSEEPTRRGLVCFTREEKAGRCSEEDTCRVGSSLSCRAPQPVVHPEEVRSGLTTTDV
jgi:hypothetical protein